MHTKWLRISLIVVILFTPLGGIQKSVLAQDTQPPQQTSTASPAMGDAALTSTGPNCALLDDPVRRSMLSGAFETALIHACGRETSVVAAPAVAGTAAVRPQAVTALGDDVLVNDPISDTTSMVQSNAVVAYNEDTGVLCSAYTDSYHGIVQGTGFTGFSSSTDGGATWHDHGAVGANSAGYPSLVWRRADGHFYLATLHSAGLGLWDLGAGCDSVSWVEMIHSGANDDRVMLTVDNTSGSYAGRFYAVWTDFTDGHIYVARSSDGVIWSGPADISNHDLVNGAWPAVDPATGDIYVAWTHWDVYPDGPIDIEMTHSDDGGATWNPIVNPMSDQVNPRNATATTNCSRPALKGNIRYFPYPQIAVDRNRVLHAVYSYDPDGYPTGDVVNVYYRRSTDQGATWEPEIQVNDNWNQTDQFSPALAVGENGDIGVFWYDRRLDSTNTLYDRYMALSRNGGQSFEANQRISDESSPVIPGGPSLATCYHGDYDGAAAGGGAFYTVWGDDRRGDADVWSDSAPYAWATLAGTVYDATSLRGLEGAHVATIHTVTGTPFDAAGDAVGNYTLSLPGNETYTVTAQVYGYAPNRVTAAASEDGGRADIPLTAVAAWDINGRVLDADTGYPVYAHVAVSGDPFDPPAPSNETWSDPFTGDYALPDLAGAIAYTLTFEATGYIPLVYFVGELDANLANPDLTLEPDLAACTAPGYQLTPPCEPATGAVLQPARIEVAGCPCETQSQTLHFANHSGASSEVLLAYVTEAGVSVELPASLGTVPNTGVKPFTVTLNLDQGMVPGTTVRVTVTAALASNPAISDTTVITGRARDSIAWEARRDSPAPSMDGAVIEYGGKLYNVGGNGSNGAVDIYDPASDSWTSGAAEPSPTINFPGDACFGYATPDDPVILLLPDADSGVSGVWHRYHIITNTWDTPALPAALPANGIWASDIVVDYRANQCYITGGATTPGNGDLSTLYRYDPADNTATLVGDFNHIPTGFDFHAGWYVPWIGSAGGICVGGGVGAGSTVYADTQCYDIAANAFNTANADLGPLPEPWWGMADAENVYGGKQQLWLANGVRADSNIINRTAYFDRVAGKFIYGPTPLYNGYRGEGAAVQGAVHLIDGSPAGFSSTTRNQRLLQCPECDCGAGIAKDAAAGLVYTGDVISYTIVITRPNWLTGTATLADVLPADVDFAGGLSASAGTAWYSDTARAVYWTAPTPGTAATTPGTVLETFTNTWAVSAVGLAYNPNRESIRYVHESYVSTEHSTHDIAYPAPHPSLHSFNLSAINSGWGKWRSGAAYDPGTDHYFLADYGGGGSYYDNIVEIDPAGHGINGWETYGASNDSYDGSSVRFILDIAVVPGTPSRYFATAFNDGGLIYELDLHKGGLFKPNTWGKVMTCTVPGIGDTSGIDYDAQNGVLYHSDWESNAIVVTDLACNALASFTCGDASARNSGVTFIEGQWPPEVWAINYNNNTTTRCEAVGREPLPETVAVTFNVTVTAPASTTIVNTATLHYRGANHTASAPAMDTYYVAGVWSDNTVHLLDANMADLGSFPAGAIRPNGMATDGETIWSGHFSPQSVVAYDFAGHELYRWQAALSGLQGMEWVNGELAISLSGASIKFYNPRTGALIRTIPGQSSVEGLAFDGTLLWQIASAWIYGTNPVDGSVVVSITNAASGCQYQGTGITSDAPGTLALVCTNGDWFRVSSADGSVLASGNNGLNMYGLAYIPPQRVDDGATFHVAPRPAIAWAKEIYVNGNYLGRYDEGPFTVVPSDDVQIVDRLDYVGTDPLFVQLTGDWLSQPTTPVAEYHTQGVVSGSAGDWSVTLLPGVPARLVRTLRLTGELPLTLHAHLQPEGLPVENRTVTFAAPVFVKTGPAVAYNGQVITYTLAFTSQNPLLGSLRLTDTLPPGVEFAGYRAASYGSVSYQSSSNSLLWSNSPAFETTRRTLDAPTPGDTALTAPAVRRGFALLASAAPELALAPSASWYNADPLPQGLVRYARAQCPGDPNRFYIISGVIGGYTDKVWRYDADSDVWTELAPFPNPGEGPSAVCYQGRIYVAGGSGGMNDFYIYDIARDTWTKGLSLPRRVWGAAMGAWNGRIYVAGGDDDFSVSGATNNVSIYDIATENWSAGATMPAAAGAAGWAQVGQHLYVVGGWDASLTNNVTTTQRYNLATNSWSVGATFTSARSDFALAATGQYLYAIGGDADGGGPFNATALVERLDYTNWYSSAWTDIADPLPEGLTAYSSSFCTTAKSGGEIWSVGGFSPGMERRTTNQYRPSEPCVTIPTSVVITFTARVVAGAGEHVVNSAQMDIHGTLITATSAFAVPLPDWQKQVNGAPWEPGLTLTVADGDIITVTDVVSTPSAFTLRETWDPDRLALIGYVTPTGGTAVERPWQMGNTTPFAYFRFDAEYSNAAGRVYFLGGRLPNGSTDGSIWEFDPATGVYTDTGVDMPVPISNYNIARLTDGNGDEVLVTFGGRAGATASVTNVVQGFYPVSRTVVIFDADPYPVATAPGGLAVVNNIAYAFGGFNGVAVIPDTYIFDITAAAGSRWTAGPALNQARSYIGAAVVDGVIYAIGGDDYTSTLIPLSIAEKLDSANPVAWDDAGVADLPVACDQMPAFGFDTDAANSLAGSIVIAGCGRYPDEYADGLRYDVATNTWDEAFPDLNEARRNHAGAFIHDGSGTGMPGLWVWGGRQGGDSSLLQFSEYYPLGEGILDWRVPSGATLPLTFIKVFRVQPGLWPPATLNEMLNIGSWSETRPVIIGKDLPAFYTLTVAMSGAGAGVVTPAVGDHYYLANASVTLTATANPGSTFAGWGGDVSGTNPTITVVMDGNKTAVAVFNLEGVCVDVTGVALTLLTAGDLYTDTAVQFHAAVSPTTAIPYTYTINYGGGASAPAGTLNNPLTLQHTFPTTGAKSVIFEAWSCAMTAPVSVTLPLTIVGRGAAGHVVYLPIVLRAFTP